MESRFINSADIFDYQHDQIHLPFSGIITDEGQEQHNNFLRMSTSHRPLPLSPSLLPLTIPPLPQPLPYFIHRRDIPTINQTQQLPPSQPPPPPLATVIGCNNTELRSQQSAIYHEYIGRWIN